MTVDHLRHLHQTTDSRGFCIFSLVHVCVNLYNGMGVPDCIPCQCEYHNCVCLLWWWQLFGALGGF